MKQLQFLIVLLFVCCGLRGNAQDNALPKIENDTLYTTTGYKIGEGQELTIGKGSTPDGDFLYIKRNTKAAIGFNFDATKNGDKAMSGAFPKH